MAQAWLRDSRGLVGTKIGEVYYSGGQESESSLSMKPSHNLDEFNTPSSSSTLSSETAEHYSFFDPYLQSDAVVPCKGVTPSDLTSATSDCRSEAGSVISQVLEQLLTFKDTETWGMHPPGESGLALKVSAGEPLHQLPGWAQHDYMMEEWQQNSSCTSLVKPVAPTSSVQSADLLHHGPWMMEMPAGTMTMLHSNLTPRLDQIHASFQHHLFDSIGAVPGFEDSHLHELLCSPYHAGTRDMTEVPAATRKAAARKNRILLRQKSAPHQRGGTDTLGSPRALKKMNSTKIPREFLMCNYVQVGDLDLVKYFSAPFMNFTFFVLENTNFGFH